MRREYCNLSVLCALLICFVAWIPVLSLVSAEPKIELIEPFLGTNVLIHFDTDANLTYELQVTETLMTNGVQSGNWTNLFVARKTPFPNHYVIVDIGTRPKRFYRLHVFD